MVRVTDMTHGRPIRLILLFSLPLMLGSVFQQLYTIVDTIIIGRGVGMQALASIGAADWINWLVLWGLQGFTQGFAILAAQEFGAGAYDRLRRVLAMIVKLSCWFGIAVTIISLLLVRPLLTLLHTDSAVFGGAQTYLYVQFGGSLIIIAYNMAAAVLRCLGDSRTPLFAIIAASFANIALDLLFVMGFGWGIFGASFATVLAQLIAFLLCLRSLRRLPFVQLTKADWKTDPAILLHLCRLGIPTGLQMSMITLGGMVLQSVLNGFGVVFVAGYTAANKLYGILESASVAFGYAMTAYMGQNRGARNAARIDAGIRAVLVLSAEFTAAIVTAMLLAGKPLLGLFLSTEETGAADALAVAYQYLMVLMAFLFALFMLQAYRSSLQGLGEMTVPTLSGFAEMLMRMGAALVLPTFIGQSGVFFAEGAAWVCAAALNLVWYYRICASMKSLNAPYSYNICTSTLDISSHGIKEVSYINYMWLLGCIFKDSFSISHACCHHKVNSGTYCYNIKIYVSANQFFCFSADNSMIYVHFGTKCFKALKVLVYRSASYVTATWKCYVRFIVLTK